MNYYFPYDNYDGNYRRMVFPLLKPFIKKENFTDKERLKLYGISEKDFLFVDSLEEADVGILAMSWNYYIKTNQKKIALDLIEKCSNINKKVFIYNAGDFGLKMPFFENAIIFRSGGYANRFTANEKIIPPFIEDPLGSGNKLISLRQYKTVPTVGFCGKANPSPINALKEILFTGWRNLMHYTGQTLQEPQQLSSSSYLRSQVLKRLSNSSLINTNFILRGKYRGGVKKNKELHKTSREFFENINNSDYTVCLRGVGNFSVRFYETLAMARIPIYINTNGILPLDKEIDWRRHVVWVEEDEIPEIAEKVKHFHQNLNAESFVKLQQSNRELWLNYLSLKGFFKNITT